MPLVSGELPRGVIENDLNNLYRAGIVNGQTRTALYNSTIGTELGIRKTDSLAISRQAEEQANTILSLRNLPEGSPIQPSNMLEMSNTAAKQYEYVVKVTMVDVDGVTLDQDYLRIQSDAILTKENVLNAANDMKETEKGTEVNVTALDVTEAWINTA